MKKLLVVIMFGLFLFGCGAAQESGYWQHDSHFKNWDHLKFSLWGYSDPTQETMKKSQEQDWWGVEIPYVPAE